MLPPAKQKTSEAVERFFAVLKEMHVEPHLLRNESEAIDALKSSLKRRECKFASVAGIPAQISKLLELALAGISHVYAERLEPVSAVSEIVKADVGITWAPHGVVNQGAIMEVVYDDAAKLVSSLPLNHIVMVPSKGLLEDISEAMIEVGKIIASSPANKKPAISFISGPSKTGDVEMRLLYGVHGPNTLTVLVLDWL